MADHGKAKGIQPGPVHVGPTLDGLSRQPVSSLAVEVGRSIERIIARTKASALAELLDRKRSTVYRWAARPEDTPVSALLVLADHDPDPEFLARVAGILLSHSASRALTREAQGRAVLIVEEIAPGKWGRR